MAIPNSFLQDLIPRADIVDVVGRSVQLKGGANLMGLCPSRRRSPSFSVSPKPSSSTIASAAARTAM